jgi:hypothetical protein
VSYERPRQAMFLPESFSSGKNYSEAKGRQIDEEVAVHGGSPSTRAQNPFGTASSP